MAGDDPRQQLLHAVVQRQPPLGRQLQHDGGDEGLGDAADMHPVLQLHGLASGLVGQAGSTDETSCPSRLMMITPGTPSVTIWPAARCNPAGGLPETARPETSCPDSGRAANAYADDAAATRSTAINTPVTRRTLQRAGLLRKLMSFFLSLFLLRVRAGSWVLIRRPRAHLHTATVRSGRPSQTRQGSRPEFVGG